ncbi:MAG: hypothetical protein ACREK5_09965 [Gemmatimonadota bacterium]
MINRKLHKDIERWLEAETRGEAEEAEAAFGVAFAALPRLEPRPGFAERVMYAFQPAPVRGFAWLSWGPKAATIGALTLVAMAIGLLPVAGVAFEAPSVGWVVDGVTGGITWLAQWLTAGLEVWSFMVRIGNAIGVAMTTPQLGAALLASALVSAAALYQLNRLLVLERRTA